MEVPISMQMRGIVTSIAEKIFFLANLLFLLSLAAVSIPGSLADCMFIVAGLIVG